LSSRLGWFLLVSGVVLDQGLKFLARADLLGFEVGPVCFGFRLNRGVFLSQLEGFGLVASSFGFLALLFLFGTVRGEGKFVLLGGALSNLVDRLWLGGVVDPLVLRGVPVLGEVFFNVADLMVLAGTAWVLREEVFRLAR